MGFVDRLLRRRADPTLSWQPFSLPIPDFDLTEMRFGKLRFGDAIDAAASLGRPDRVEWTRGEYCELLYASGGFQIDFDSNRFAYLAFFIGPDELLPKHPAFELSKPRLRGGTEDGSRLSRDTQRPRLERLFGAADSVDADSDETILYYARQGVTMEFELDPSNGRLKRWNLYPK
jgi:hypothetical protein